MTRDTWFIYWMIITFINSAGFAVNLTIAIAGKNLWASIPLAILTGACMIYGFVYVSKEIWRDK